MTWRDGHERVDGGSRRPDETPGVDPREGRDLVLWFIGTALENWRIILGLPLVAVAGVLLITWLSPDTYTARTAFTPQSNDARQAEVSGLAQRFGLDLPSQAGAVSMPAFFAYLLKTDRLLRSAVTTRLPVAGASTDSVGTLAGLWSGSDSPSVREIESAIEELRGRSKVRVEPEIGVVHLAVTMRHGSLAREVAARMVELVNAFNLESRRSQADEEVEFLRQRLMAAKEDLRTSEDSLRAFLERNRQYENSPTLRFEADRLRRRVALQQDVYTSLAQALEDAKIQQVRNTPVITVVQPPRAPVSPDSQSVFIKIIVAGMLGLFVVWSWLAGRAWLLGGEREDEVGRQRLGRKWEEARDDYERLLREAR